MNEINVILLDSAQFQCEWITSHEIYRLGSPRAGAGLITSIIVL